MDYRIGSVHLLYNDKGEVVDVDVSADTFKTIVDGHFCSDLAVSYTHLDVYKRQR